VRVPRFLFGEGIRAQSTYSRSIHHTRKRALAATIAARKILLRRRWHASTTSYMGRAGKIPDCSECERLEDLVVGAGTDYSSASMIYHSLVCTDPKVPTAFTTLRKAMKVRDEYQSQFDEHVATHERAWTVSASG
jgi:hypothetical protein